MPPLSTDSKRYMHTAELEEVAATHSQPTDGFPIVVTQSPENDSQIYKSMFSLTRQIARLIGDRIPENIRECPDFPKMTDSLSMLFHDLMQIIYHKSQSDSQIDVRTCGDTDIEIGAILEYVANIFTDTDGYASQFDKFLDEFCTIILQPDTPFDPLRIATVSNEWIAVYEDRITHVGRLLSCIASFDVRASANSSAILASRDITRDRLEKLRTGMQNAVYRTKCILALIAIIISNIDATDAIRAALSQHRDCDSIVCEHVRTSIADMKQIGIGTVIKDRLQQHRILSNSVIFHNACCKRIQTDANSAHPT